MKINRLNNTISNKKSYKGVREGMISLAETAVSTNRNAVSLTKDAITLINDSLPPIQDAQTAYQVKPPLTKAGTVLPKGGLPLA